MKLKSESEVAQLCQTLSDPMHCSLPGSSVHGTNSKIPDSQKKNRYTQLNAEFQRIARRDKKVFFIEQCKVLENNIMEKTREGF